MQKETKRLKNDALSFDFFTSDDKLIDRMYPPNLAKLIKRDLAEKRKEKNEPTFKEKVDFICQALGCPEDEILSMYCYKIEAIYSYLKELTKNKRIG